MFERFRRARAANGTPRHLAETALDDSVDMLAPRIPMATLRDDLIACEECDALHRRSSVDGVGDESDDIAAALKASAAERAQVCIGH